MPVKLSEMQQTFVDAYTGNIKETAELCGLKYGYCRNLMTLDKVKQAIAQRDAEKNRPYIMSREERQKLWTKIATDENERTTDRLKATEHLAKSEGDFIERIQHDIGDDTAKNLAAMLEIIRERRGATRQIKNVTPVDRADKTIEMIEDDANS